jgi:predicted nucleotidyltransferase
MNRKKEAQMLPISVRHKNVLDRFTEICQEDDRVLAAFLGGSYARGATDPYSDLDLYIITTDLDYQDFTAGKEAFIRLLGEPLFLEDFGTAYALFFILSDHTEGELWIGHESRFRHIYTGSYKTLLDKNGILTGAIFPPQPVDKDGQKAILAQQLNVFWHEMAHFIKAMGRGQLWFAYGQLEVMRGICINLARLQHNFLDGDVGEEPYFKVEQAVPVAKLSPLETTFCALEFSAMLQAAQVILRFYQGLGSRLASEHGVTYQTELENMMRRQLADLAG